jgi:hypothetical protein
MGLPALPSALDLRDLGDGQDREVDLQAGLWAIRSGEIHGGELQLSARADGGSNELGGLFGLGLLYLSGHRCS